MHTTASAIQASTRRNDGYLGLRMTADDFFALPESDVRHELVDGVVLMSPGPTPLHQKVAFWLAAQLAAHLENHPVGEAFVELDVHLGRGPTGEDLVYRPDLIFLRTERATACRERILGAPDLVVEIVSETSRRFDRETKRADYERCGVDEYWIIDPEQNAMTFYRLSAGHLIEVPPLGDRLTSHAVPGFSLDLTRSARPFVFEASHSDYLGPTIRTLNALFAFAVIFGRVASLPKWTVNLHFASSDEGLWRDNTNTGATRAQSRHKVGRRQALNAS